MVNRREFLGITACAGATLAFTPKLLSELQDPGGKLLQRTIPSSGESIPVIGLGRGSITPSTDRTALKEVFKALVDNGGKVLDTVHGGERAEEVAGSIANELGIQDRLFWSASLFVAGSAPPQPGGTGAPPKVDAAAVQAKVDRSFARFKVPRIDLFQVLAHADVPTHLGVLSALKKEGRVRYVGVTDLPPPPSAKTDPAPFARLESIMRNEPIDFVGVPYGVGDRRAEQTILPLAAERKIGVLAYFALDRSNLIQRAGTRPLPEWAADFDAKTWAQFFLKYVVSHPAVTVARTGTSQVKHLLDNLGGGIGRLPDDATRKRMAELVDSWPPAPPRRAGR
jgi:aryl-alcohol dehydrogenase-like predicted oxidoreductase